jgi:hypothetical protein
MIKQNLIVKRPDTINQSGELRFERIGLTRSLTSDEEPMAISALPVDDGTGEASSALWHMRDGLQANSAFRHPDR